MSALSLRLILVVLLIAAIGIATIYSSTINSPVESERQLFWRQGVWLLLGLVCLFTVSSISYRKLWDFAYLLYGLGMIFLILVAFLGLVRLGAQRWLKILWFNFQPSEMMKLIVVIFLARYFSNPGEGLGWQVESWGFIKAVLIPFAFVSLPALFIFEQPDLGTAAFIFFVFIAMLFVAKVRLKYVLCVLSGIILLSPLLWYILKDYQKDRLLVFINPNADPLGAGYTIIQSKTAIATGGLFGKGWLGGSHSQLHFLPESHTDFIFATFAEEWGMFGSLLLLFLYYLLISSALKVAQRAPDRFGYLLASGISLILTIQVFINIAMTMGLAPVVGLPLPLLSYGGSSLLVTLLSVGLLVNIEKRIEL